MHQYFFPYALQKNKGWNINYRPICERRLCGKRSKKFGKYFNACAGLIDTVREIVS
jgi:hypothetical protein